MKKQMSTSIKKYGWAWIILSPILFFMAIISTVNSDLIYHVQLICFGIIAILGLIAGIATLSLKTLASKILMVLSWLCFLYFSGAGLIILVYVIPSTYKNIIQALFMFLISIGVIVTSIPFLFMAIKINSENKS